MKKIKELVCFLIAIAILWLLPLAGILYVNLLADAPAFVGLQNYIRLFLNDPIFITALFNTYWLLLLFGTVSVAVFSLIVYLLRKKATIRRPAYFVGCALVGSVGALIGRMGQQAALLASSDSVTDAVDTIYSHIGGLRPGAFELIRITDVLGALQVGVLIAFLVWIIERIVGIVKSYQKKRA